MVMPDGGEMVLHPPMELLAEKVAETIVAHLLAEYDIRPKKKIGR